MLTVQTLSIKVYEHMLRMILSGELPPGTSLREIDLATRLGVSRTPIREAVHRLSEYGVVEMRPNQGAVVRHLGREELIDLHQLREALEGMSAELACGRLTPRDFEHLDRLAAASSDENAPGYFEAFDRFDVGLHSLVADRSGNPLLAREIVKLQGLTMLIHDQIESVLIDGKRIPPDERTELRTMCWRQHVEIVEALRQGDPATCRRIMVEHVRACREYKLRLFPEDDSPSSTRPRRA